MILKWYWCASLFRNKYSLFSNKEVTFSACCSIYVQSIIRPLLTVTAPWYHSGYQYINVLVMEFLSHMVYIIQCCSWFFSSLQPITVSTKNQSIYSHPLLVIVNAAIGSIYILLDKTYLRWKTFVEDTLLL